jgi:small redox-active disulfide protein 2
VLVKVLGSGCANCRRLEANVREALQQAGVAAEIVKVEDVVDIMGYGVTATPALVVDEQVLVSGRVPSASQIVGLLQGRS